MNKNKIALILAVLMVFVMVFSACQPAATNQETEAEDTTTEDNTSGETDAEAETETEAEAEETTAEETSGEKKILRIAENGEYDTMNPFTSQMIGGGFLAFNEGLVVSNNENSYIPVLAVDIPTYENGGIVDREDGKIDMTWKLREGVKWHDGVEFTSEDVCFTYNWLVSDNAELVYNQLDYKNISACTMVDDYTVTFTWDTVYAPYATLFDSILPKHILEGKDIPTYNEYNLAPIGTGPFKFEEWKSGEYIRFVKNENYWRGPEYPAIDELIFYFVPDPNTRFNGVLAGEYDYAELSTTQASEQGSIDGYEIEWISRNLWIYFGFSINSENGAALFSDKSVRQALFYAVDRESIVNDLLNGTVTIGYTNLPPSSPYHNPDVMKFEYDVEKAKSLLDEAGWVDSDGDGIRDKDGVKFSFTIPNRSGRTDRIEIAQVIQSMYKEIGVEVLFTTLEDAAWIEKWVSGDWDAIIGGWILPADPSFTMLYACGASNNMTGFCSEELDEAMHAADQSLEFSERRTYTNLAQEILAEEAFAMVLYYVATPTAYTSDLLNFKASGTNIGSFWNVYEWDLNQ